MRLREKAGGYQIMIFTSPTPFRAGPVDISVLVQDAATEEYVPNVRVTVRRTARRTVEVLEYPATAEAATNKLLRAAEFQLPEPGWWDVDIAVEGPHGPALVRFEVQADEPPPRWLELWPWFTWPALVVALFSVHRVLARKGLKWGREMDRVGESKNHRAAGTTATELKNSGSSAWSSERL